MKRPEQTIQRTIMQHAEHRLARDAFICHVPNGGKRSAIEAAIFKSLGVVAGFPDILAIREGQTFALELKSSSGRLTDIQSACQERLKKAGATVGTVWGLDPALAWLEEHGILRGHAS